MELIEMKSEDVNDFCRLRLQLFKELKEIGSTEDVMYLVAATKEYYISHLDNDLLCWGIRTENKIVAIASLCIFFRVPYMRNLSGKEGYVLNVYTEPLFRRRGLSKNLLDTIVNYAKTNDIARLWLNSSEQGTSIYQSCGFVENANEMVLFL